MRLACTDEAPGRLAEHELEYLPAVAANLQPPAVLVHRRHRRMLEPAAEVREASACTDAGKRS